MGSFTAIPNHLFKKISGLTGKSLYVYVLLRSKLRMRKGTTLIPVNNIITCSYAEAKRNGILNTAFARGLQQLVKIGLIRIEKKGSYGGGRNPTEYEIL